MQKLVLLAAVVVAALFAPLTQAADAQPASAMTDESHRTKRARVASQMVTIRSPEDPDADAAGIKILFGAQDVLRQPTALVNKNTVATGNNVAITRSNIIFTQDDRMALVDAIENLIRNRNDNDSDDADLMTTILAVIGAKASDSKIVSQVRATLGCRKHDAKMLRQCIVALVDMSKDTEASDEVTSPGEDNQDEYYRGRTTVVNPPGPGVYAKKTVAVGGRRRYYPEDTSAEDADKDDDDKDDESTVLVLVPMYRVAFRYPIDGGFRYGWRYPLSYWRVYGRRFYPVTCGFGRTIGQYYYC